MERQVDPCQRGKFDTLEPLKLTWRYSSSFLRDRISYTIDILIDLQPQGVDPGQRFTPNIVNESPNQDIYYPPVGAWKDGCCGWTERCLEADNACGIWFLPILLGQIQSRFNMNCCGVLNKTTWTFAFWCAFKIIFLFWDPFQTDENTEKSDDTIPYVQLLMPVFLVIAIFATRVRIRKMFALPGSHLGDCCLSCCCCCCSVTQMARHTANYDVNRAKCWSRTGLPETQKVAAYGKLKNRFIVSQPKVV